MCPKFECLQRRYQKMVDYFELVSREFAFPRLKHANDTLG